jgi:hypothetical protein
MPIACTLGSEEHRDRRERWLRLTTQALEEKRLTPQGVQLRLHALSGVEEEARALVDLERDCCAFARWSVEGHGATVTIDITAGGEGVKALHAQFDFA